MDQIVYDRLLDFEPDLNAVLPSDLPGREAVVRRAARHLAAIMEANANFNLTRITSPREAAIKHVADSLIPWRLFESARHVMDAGTGPGFPGIPLALVFPEIRFTLVESTGKKARFVESVVAELELANVVVSTGRAEELARETSADVITARAFAPLNRTISFLAPALKRGASALLYKGPETAVEIADAAREIQKFRARVNVALRYDLPDSLGGRTIIRIST